MRKFEDFSQFCIRVGINEDEFIHFPDRDYYIHCSGFIITYESMVFRSPLDMKFAMKEYIDSCSNLEKKKEIFYLYHSLRKWVQDDFIPWIREKTGLFDGKEILPEYRFMMDSKEGTDLFFRMYNVCVRKYIPGYIDGFIYIDPESLTKEVPEAIRNKVKDFAQAKEEYNKLFLPGL